MSVGIEALFTSALGLQVPWVVEDVKLDNTQRRIDFEIGCQCTVLSDPAGGAAAQPIHDRQRRSWRHLDFFQFEAWPRCDVQRIACASCGKTTLAPAPLARSGSGFTAAFKALTVALCRELPVRQADSLLHRSDKQLWRRIESCVDQARAPERFAGVQFVGIDETSLRRGPNYITVMHDLDAKRLLFVTEGRDHQAVVDFAVDLKAHGGDSADVPPVCMDMSAAYAKGAALALPQAQIRYNRFHVVATASEALDLVRRAEMRDDAPAVRSALGDNDCKTLKQLMWGMRRNPSGWSQPQLNAVHWLQHSTPKCTRTWRVKMALQEVYAEARAHNKPEQASTDLRGWLSWALRCRLAPFKKLATTIKECFDAVVRGMFDHHSNAFVEAMKGLPQQAKRAARGFRTTTNFIAIPYLRMSKVRFFLW